ncbi:hypothetical protein HGRIS_004348 [Hohenbuehelia grisea]|uniref:Uncharacterized protein n=1 Tax=Hohenbuehelia grisea TaxID=104357 RepID=A0ABR3IPH2_9AGAR
MHHDNPGLGADDSDPFVAYYNNPYEGSNASIVYNAWNPSIAQLVASVTTSFVVYAPSPCTSSSMPTSLSLIKDIPYIASTTTILAPKSISFKNAPHESRNPFLTADEDEFLAHAATLLES